MEMKICIVDDEQVQIDRLQEYINQHETFLEFKTITFHDSTDVNILAEEFDLYFLDIDMPKRTGFELAKMIQKKYPDAIFIFVSAHSEFVYDSFKFNAFYFVRKFTFEADMIDALHLAENKLKKYAKKYEINSVDGEKQIVNFGNILYFEKMINQLLVTLTNGKTYTERKSMKQLLQEVNLDLVGFVLINAGTCVNLKGVNKLVDSEMVMSNGEHLAISRRRFSDVRNAYHRFLMESE
ncbi:LytTR family two component transcriptional regulator [Breznakia blatticola]|uniref:LytTR family two component transcriptional regulator n=1 Tax=Breznakia blatticola TaxID=1754012 RepID=A0A4R7ZSE6_9FIRM|nr:LytTR family DNA-binding domain-containing protein [Breznakia blatticola]TDW20545.1 LytTR family two component transcriptional regulator [Breznakia blatticola]